MKTLDKPSSGALGNIVASRNHYGPYTRRRLRPRKRRRTKRATVAQRDTQAEKRAVAKALAALSEEQIQAWVRASEEVLSRTCLGKRWPITWQAYFHKVNDPRAGFKQGLLLDPPPRGRFGQNPVGRLVISNVGGEIGLKLEVAEPPSADIMIFGAKPCRRTVLKCFVCPRIGPLPAPVGGLSDITEQYMAKHGKPKAGERVFIRTRQYLDGPEDLFQETSAVVPAPAGGGGAGAGV